MDPLRGGASENPRPALFAPWTPAVRLDLFTRYLGFPFWDVITFPVTMLTGLEERDTIEVVRFSPRDTDLLADPQTPKLKGAALGHFGAFFHRSDRENDYL